MLNWLGRDFKTSMQPKVPLPLKKFTNSRLASKRDDPDVWITNLQDIKLRIENQGSKIDDVDFMIHIINNLRREYEISQAKLEDRLNYNQDPLTIEEIQTELNLKFLRMNPKKNTRFEEEETEETVLFSGGFKGFCHG